MVDVHAPAPSVSPTPPLGAAPPPFSDACHPVDDARNMRGWLVFLGEFVASKDDDESGYAHALRFYSFKPVKAWRGVASPDEIGAVVFLPNASDNLPHHELPALRRGQEALVIVDRGGISGKMQILSEAVPRETARSRIEALGPPCWVR
jgi:hypothetical protein